MAEENSIQYNLAHDEDKDHRITVYLDAHDRAALEVYRQEQDQSISDAAGDLIRAALRRHRINAVLNGGNVIV